VEVFRSSLWQPSLSYLPVLERAFGFLFCFVVPLWVSGKASWFSLAAVWPSHSAAWLVSFYLGPLPLTLTYVFVSASFWAIARAAGCLRARQARPR